MSYKCISIDAAQALIEKNEVTLVDVRDSESFLESHIHNSINVLHDNLEDFISDTDKDKPLIAYCYHGNNSKGAAAYFVGKGFQEVYSIEGGFDEWRMKYAFNKASGYCPPEKPHTG